MAWRIGACAQGGNLPAASNKTCVHTENQRQTQTAWHFDSSGSDLHDGSDAGAGTDFRGRSSAGAIRLPPRAQRPAGGYQRQAITILPSVGSLKALRAAKASEAPEPFAGFGNPLLTGLDGADKSAWAKQECGKPAPPKQSRIASIVASIASMFRGGAVNVEDLRRQPPLPETADELCAVGRELGVPEAGQSKAIQHATVSKVKALSASGDLACARVVHFATHGLLAGETAMFARNKAEPALLLTPPAQASEEDNGLLTASEVAQLNLNADWVVLSACNTAAGSNDGAEALSGLARAFFYAGARSLLVSHWYVDSEAAVAITTGAVNAMKANPKISRAEGWSASRPHRQGRALRASIRLGAFCARRQWGAVMPPETRGGYPKRVIDFAWTIRGLSDLEEAPATAALVLKDRRA